MMREYNRPLDSHAVGRILAKRSRKQTDKFLDLVSMTNPSTVASVLDEQVIDFLQQFITAA